MWRCPVCGTHWKGAVCPLCARWPVARGNPGRGTAASRWSQCLPPHLTAPGWTREQLERSKLKITKVKRFRGHSSICNGFYGQSSCPSRWLGLVFRFQKSIFVQKQKNGNTEFAPDLSASGNELLVVFKIVCLCKNPPHTVEPCTDTDTPTC